MMDIKTIRKAEALPPLLVPTCFASMLGVKPPRRWWQIRRRSR